MPKLHCKSFVGEGVFTLAVFALVTTLSLLAGAQGIPLPPPPAVPAGATVLEAPPDDDGSFGRLVGIFAGALDSGVEPAAAFAEAVAASGWEPVAD